MKCTSKGCVFPALLNEDRCINHREKPVIPTVPAPKEFEIVPMSLVPTFKIRNEKAYNIAKAVSTLAADHALKVKSAGNQKLDRSLVVTVTSTFRRGFPQFKLRFRLAPGCIYLWKEVAAAAKK